MACNDLDQEVQTLKQIKMFANKLSNPSAKTAKNRAFQWSDPNATKHRGAAVSRQAFSVNSPYFHLKELSTIVGVRGGSRTGYLIPGCDGMGAWTRPEILPPPPSSPSPPSPKIVLFDKSQILSILTHSRDTDARPPGN